MHALTNHEKAAKRYRLAYSLLTSEKADCPIMLPAIVNNIGHVHRLLGHVEKARRCFQHLLMALMFVTVGSSVRLPEDLQERFFSNVMHMILNDRRLAPAAWKKRAENIIDFLVTRQMYFCKNKFIDESFFPALDLPTSLRVVEPSLELGGCRMRRLTKNRRSPITVVYVYWLRNWLKSDCTHGYEIQSK